jgi:hypothetical protein
LPRANVILQLWKILKVSKFVETIAKDYLGNKKKL